MNIGNLTFAEGNKTKCITYNIMGTKEDKVYRMDAHAITDGKAEYHFTLDFLIFQEDGAYIAYCPSLDISTCADTHNEAISNFYEMFQLHIETCLEMGTLQEDLLSHGWKLRDKSLTPPALITLIKKPEVRKLFDDNRNFERISAPTVIPAFA